MILLIELLALGLILLLALVEAFMISIGEKWRDGVGNDFGKTRKRSAKRLIREIREMETHARQRNHILRYLKKIRINQMKRTTSQVEDLPEILDQFAARKVLISLFPLPPIDLGLTLTTDILPTGKELILYRPPVGLPHRRVDVTAALDLARSLDTIMAASKVLQDLKELKAIHLDTRENLLFKVVADETIFVDSEEQLVERSDVAANRNEITSVMLYRPHYPFGLTLDVSAACDVARAFETMIAALYWCLHYQTPSGQTIPLVHFGYFGDFKPVLVDETIFVDNEQIPVENPIPISTTRDCFTTGKEVVLYRPRFFHGLTLDLTVACDVARMCQAISAAPICMDYRRITELSIPAEFFKVIGDQTQIVADETVIVDSEEQSSLNTTAVSESCKQQQQQQQNDVIGLGISQVNDDEKGETEHSHAFLYDDDFVELRPPVPIRPRELVKWVVPSDVTDNSLDLDEVESWEVSDMFATNEANFGYKSSFDETMSEYTTLLVVEDTTDYVLRRERACRLADEIEAKKRADQAIQAKQPKKRKKKARRRSRKSECPY